MEILVPTPYSEVSLYEGEATAQVRILVQVLVQVEAAAAGPATTPVGLPVHPLRQSDSVLLAATEPEPILEQAAAVEPAALASRQTG
jgi:hypothetical protein